MSSYADFGHDPVSVDLEVELRLDDRVVAVGVDRAADTNGDATLAVLTTSDVSSMGDFVRAVARSHGSDVIVEVSKLEAAGNLPVGTVGRAEGRVALERVEFDPDTGMAEVWLAQGGRRGSGRAGGGPLLSGARATLAALGTLGVASPFSLVAADRVAPGADTPVVVCLRPLPEGDERIGVARADDDTEAASRATLNALNRHLSDGSLDDRS